MLTRDGYDISPEPDARYPIPADEKLADAFYLYQLVIQVESLKEQDAGWAGTGGPGTFEGLASA